ncbi:DUF3093 domain-containing protein [Desertivibrio insolitus]|uniref:DUF3093 domain-containing protein n=1 Tax=Herbiconiux sp. SYSU D00978 TaxID=2812562 RepID=UPI001A96BEC7|nr:DUF3093 domain-containing protein [Herbiconiux sp. SYSU D00978]
MPAFRERLRPPYSLYLALVLLIPAMLVIFLPIDPRIGFVVAPLAFVVAVVVITLIAPTVSVTAGELVAGRAHLPLEYTGQVTVHRGGEAALQRGQHLDARAWLVIRGGIDPVVRVEVTDERDPVPYWLVSSRRPDELAAAIAAGRDARR